MVKQEINKHLSLKEPSSPHKVVVVTAVAGKRTTKEQCTGMSLTLL